MNIPRTYCRCLGLIYAVAFWSALIQAPGLFGFDGLEPVTALAEKENLWPSIVSYSDVLGLPPDVALMACCVAGVALATLVAMGVVNGVLMALLWFLYLSVYLCSRTFMTFQWDILLLEIGFVSSLWPPLLGFGADKARYATSVQWLLRFVFFKLMLMSGVVKLQSQCNTWLGLTALEYHYATQCIPSPLAWYAHQLPPIIQKLSVAATLVIELPATILIMVPLKAFARLGVVLQVLLQILIMLTGNYNFFNVLTSLLCIPVWSWDESTGPDDEDAGRALGVEEAGPVLWVYYKLRRIEDSRIGKVILGIGAVTTVAWFTWSMFSLSYIETAAEWASAWKLRLAFSVDDMNAVLDKYHEPCMYWCLGMLVVAGGLHISRELSHTVPTTWLGKATKVYRAVWAIAITSIAVGLLFPVSAVPFLTLRNHLIEEHRHAVNMFVGVQKWHISNGYGLFRSMTGVGSPGRTESGEFATQVARPEVIVEASLDGKDWQEVEFLYKPGDVASPLKQVAPHQPRLDWQMWFAALARVDNSPWFIHFMSKLLEGAPDVYALIDMDRYPFKKRFHPHSKAIVSSDFYGDALNVVPPKFVRATLYHYDLTRWPQPWLSTEAHTNTTAVWGRKVAKHFLPKIAIGDQEIKSYLRRVGWKSISTKERIRGLKARDTCNFDGSADTASMMQSIGAAACEAVRTTRRHQMRVPVFVGLCFVVSLVWPLVVRRVRSHGRSRWVKKLKED